MPRPPPRSRVGEAVGELRVLGDDLPEQPDHPVRGDLEPGRVEDLRADVRVQADQRAARAARHPADRLGGVPAGEREAELLVLVRGGDELVGVRLDADGDPDHHRAPGRPSRARQARPAWRSRGTSRRRWRRCRRLHGQRQLGVGLVGAVQRDPAGREAGAQCQPQLAGRAHVQGQPLVVRASARSRCTGTPCRRSARPRRRRRRRRNPGSGCGSRPRR